MFIPAEPILPFAALRGMVVNFLQAQTSWHDGSETTTKTKEKGKGEGKQSGKPSSSLGVCLYCGQPGHSYDQCNLRRDIDDGNSDNTVNWNLQCWTCWGWGHKENVCPSKGHGKGMVNTLLGILGVGTTATGGRPSGVAGVGTSGLSEVHAARGGAESLPETHVARDNNIGDEFENPNDDWIF